MLFLSKFNLCGWVFVCLIRLVPEYSLHLLCSQHGQYLQRTVKPSASWYWRADWVLTTHPHYPYPGIHWPAFHILRINTYSSWLSRLNSSCGIARTQRIHVTASWMLTAPPKSNDLHIAVGHQCLVVDHSVQNCKMFYVLITVLVKHQSEPPPITTLLWPLLFLFNNSI